MGNRYGNDGERGNISHVAKAEPKWSLVITKVDCSTNYHRLINLNTLSLKENHSATDFWEGRLLLLLLLLLSLFVHPWPIENFHFLRFPSLILVPKTHKNSIVSLIWVSSIPPEFSIFLVKVFVSPQFEGSIWGFPTWVRRRIRIKYQYWINYLRSWRRFLGYPSVETPPRRCITIWWGGSSFWVLCLRNWRTAKRSSRTARFEPLSCWELLSIPLWTFSNWSTKGVSFIRYLFAPHCVWLPRKSLETKDNFEFYDFMLFWFITNENSKLRCPKGRIG